MELARFPEAKPLNTGALTCLIAILSFCGCTPDPPSPQPDPLENLPENLTMRKICKDILVYAHNQEGTIRLTATAQPILEKAYEAGGEMEHTSDLSHPDPEVSVFLTRGRHLDGFSACDTRSPAQTEIDTRWYPRSGVAVVHVLGVEKTGDNKLVGQAEFTMQNAVFDELELKKPIKIDLSVSGRVSGEISGSPTTDETGTSSTSDETSSTSGSDETGTTSDNTAPHS